MDKGDKRQSCSNFESRKVKFTLPIEEKETSFNDSYSPAIKSQK